MSKPKAEAETVIAEGLAGTGNIATDIASAAKTTGKLRMPDHRTVNHGGHDLQCKLNLPVLPVRNSDYGNTVSVTGTATVPFTVAGAVTVTTPL